MRVVIALSCFLVLLWACKSESTQTATIKQDTVSKTTSTRASRKQIVFFGNSLSAGYGLKDAKNGFVGLIAKRLDSLRLDYDVINAGLSGETTAGGLDRVDWILEQEIDIFVLELGGNDGLRGINPSVSIQNLQGIIDKVQNKHPEAKIILAGMEAPPNMGNDFTIAFRAMYPKLSKINNLALIPFLLDGIAADPNYNLADGIHPNIAGHRIVAKNVWTILEDLL